MSGRPNLEQSGPRSGISVRSVVHNVGRGEVIRSVIQKFGPQLVRNRFVNGPRYLGSIFHRITWFDAENNSRTTDRLKYIRTEILDHEPDQIKYQKSTFNNLFFIQTVLKTKYEVNRGSISFLS